MGPAITDWKKGERFEIFGEVFEVSRIDKARRELQAQTVHRDMVRDRDILIGGKTFHIRDLGIAKPFDKDKWERMYGKSLTTEKGNGRLAQLKVEAGLSPIITKPGVAYLRTGKSGSLAPDRIFLKSLVKFAIKGYGSLSTVEKAELTETSGGRGGYTVPPEYSNALFETIAEFSIFWPRARVLPMGSLELTLGVPDFTTPQVAGTTSLFGGLLYTFLAATNAAYVPSETEPAFKQLVLHSWDLIGNAVASIQYVEDLLAMEDGEERLLRLFGQAAAYYADWAFFNGTGASNELPVGILNAPCKISVNRAVSGHVGQSDLSSMAAKLLPRSWATAIWCVSATALGDVMKTTGWQPNEYIERAPRGSIGYIDGLPCYPTEKLPALGTPGDVCLIDPDLYIIGDRKQPEISASREEPSTFQKNQMMFRTNMRVDGKPLLSNYVTLADGVSTASSVVVLN